MARPETTTDISIETAARTLLSVLHRELAASSPVTAPPTAPPVTPARPTTSAPPPPPSNLATTTTSGGDPRHSVQQALKRQFPSIFGKGEQQRGKKRFTNPPGRAAPLKCTGFNIYVLPGPSIMTPHASCDLELAHAGLGKRVVSLPDDSKHQEIVNLLEEEFPKLRALQNRWMFYKAPGGGGRRKLSEVPTNTEGYSCRLLKAASSNGKSTLYVAPLQEDLDTEPLSYDSVAFAKMPHVPCLTCGAKMPLQMLALHKDLCKGNIHEERSDVEDQRTDEVVVLEEEEQKSGEAAAEELSGIIVPRPDKIGACPICNNKYPMAELTIHASMCGDSLITLGDEPSPGDGCDGGAGWDGGAGHQGGMMKNLTCPDDIVQYLKDQVQGDKEFNICVSRVNLVERGFLQWKRQKRGSPANRLKIKFVGESGVDTGALRKEFLTEMITGIERRLFVGQERGKTPQYSISDLDNELFRVAGEVFAVSLAQGGPAPSFLKEWCYSFLSSGRFEPLQVSKEDVDDVELKLLISQVEESEDLFPLTDEIISCGYTGTINADNKDKIVRAIVLHGTMRVLPMLSGIREGLKVYSLVTILQRHQDLCRSFFVPGDESSTPDTDFIMQHLAAEMSTLGTSRHARETEILNWFQDFLQELEAPDDNAEVDPQDEEPFQPSVAGVLQWLTGQGHKPLLLGERQAFKICVQFDHDCVTRMPEHTLCYPTVSACSSTITFPTAHLSSYPEFKTIMMQALKSGRGFHRV